MFVELKSTRVIRENLKLNTSNFLKPSPLEQLFDELCRYLMPSPGLCDRNSETANMLTLGSCVSMEIQNADNHSVCECNHYGTARRGEMPLDVVVLLLYRSWTQATKEYRQVLRVKFNQEAHHNLGVVWRDFSDRN
ncbi:MAG: hypothetical protein Q7U82_01545 [Gammaproteobacteria bacterium]|nr:hypothetical protein [Gammaproteobacteria bacterium]